MLLTYDLPLRHIVVPLVHPPHLPGHPRRRRDIQLFKMDLFIRRHTPLGVILTDVSFTVIPPLAVLFHFNDQSSDWP